MKLSKRIEGMKLSPIRKFNKYAIEAESKGVKVYHFNIGQPDIMTPEAFKEAIRKYDDPVLAYCESQGLTVLQDALINYFGRFGAKYERGDILVTNGGSEALSLVFQAILDEGDEVIMAEPYYTNYDTFVRAADGVIVPITTYAENGYRYVDKEKIESLIGPKTKAIAIINPNNPTGTVLTKDEMQVLADIVKKHDLWLVCDEVYREFCYDGLAMDTFARFEEISDRVIIIDSVSKRFSACGARVGCVISKNADLITNILKICQGRLCCPTIDQLGAAALYGLDPAYFDDIKKEYEERRNASYEALHKIPGIICEMPQGAFYMTVKLPVDDAEDFLMFLLTEFRDNNETLMFAPASGFYVTKGLGKNEMRLAYVLKKEDMVRGIEILGLGLEAYKNR